MTRKKAPKPAPEWYAPFFEGLAMYGSVPKAVTVAAQRTGETRFVIDRRVRVGKRQNASFKKRFEEAMAVFAVRGFSPPEHFPSHDFLAFREMCCAYQKQADKTFVRATNQWFHRDSYRRFETTRRMINVFPPGHNKTTLYAIELPTWLIMSDRNVRIAVVQKNATEAKKVINAVQDRLSDTDYYEWLAEGLEASGVEAMVDPLQTWFASTPFKPEQRRPGATWGAEQFTVEGRRSGEKDYTMQAFGVGSGIQGGRYDYIILDDVQDPLDADNPQNSQKLLDWFERVIMGRITDTQTVIVNGNFFSPDDFMHRLIAAHPEFVVTNYPALIPRWRSKGFEVTNGQEDLVPLWPEYWTMDGLRIKRIDVKERAWHYTWMQSTDSFADSTFNREAIEDCKSHEMRLGEVPEGVTHIYLGVDPAAAEQGYCAMVLWGLNNTTKQRYLIDVFNKKGMRNWNNVTDQIGEFCRAFNVRTVVIEGNNTQKAGLTEHPYFRKLITSLGPRWEVYQTVTGSGARAIQSNYDITVLGRMFDEGMITIPYGGDYAEIRRVDEFIDQLCSWRTDEEGRSIKHLVRDQVMALLFAESEAFVQANRTVDTAPRQKKASRWGRGHYGKKDPEKVQIRTLTDEEVAEYHRLRAEMEGEDPAA